MNNCLEKECSNFEELLGFYSSRLISYPLIPPEHVYFALTNRCSLKCLMCDIPKTPSGIEDELSTSKIKEIILQIKDLGVKHLVFSGGEPLLREDLLDILEFSVSNDIKNVALITNGVLLDDCIVQKLIKIQLCHITISLDGLKKTNDEIRGKGVFEKTVANIDKLNFYKEKFNAAFPTVGINFTIMNRNIDDILDIIELAKNKRYNAIVFQPILFSNISMYEKKTNILWPSKEDVLKLRKVMHKVINLKNKLNGLGIYTEDAVLKTIPDYFTGKRLGSDFKCFEAIKRIVITYDGKVWSCMGSYGNLKEDNLKNIWFSKDAMAIRDKIKNCNAHCLQDCVYFPSNILDKTKELLKKIKGAKAKKKEIKSRLLAKLRYYTNILSEENKDVPSPFGCNDSSLFRKEIDTLCSIKKELMKIS